MCLRDGKNMMPKWQWLGRYDELNLKSDVSGISHDSPFTLCFMFINIVREVGPSHL